MFTLERKSSKSSNTPTPKKLRFEKKQPVKNPIASEQSSVLEKESLSHYLSKQKPVFNRELEISYSLDKTIQKLKMSMKALNLKESDVSMLSCYLYLKTNKLPLATNKQFDRFLYNLIGIASKEGSFEESLTKDVSFTKGLSNIFKYLSREMDPESFEYFQTSISSYFDYIAQRKDKKRQIQIQEKKETSQTNSEIITNIQNVISEHNLESSISIEELINQINKGGNGLDQSALHHLVSQMDFIRKNLHKRSGTVKFMNQAMFLVKSLPKLSDQTKLISAIKHYISKKEDEKMWETEEEWEG
jgi:hypothetical protein